MREPVVAIDGPAGSGKGAVSALLAQRFGYTLVETGAIYRALALRALGLGLALDDEAGLAALGATLVVDFAFEDGVNRVRLDGEDVSRRLREPAVAAGASRIAGLPAVRAALLDIQRRLGHRGGVVAEGRDIGTVVFPAADVKLFLTASEEVRARRRWLQLKESGHAQDFAAVLAEQRERDARDTGRAVAPLRQASGAILVDSSELTLEEVVAEMGGHVEQARERMGLASGQ